MLVEQVWGFVKWLMFLTPPESVDIPELDSVMAILKCQRDEEAIGLYYSEISAKVDYDLVCSDGLDTKASIFAGVVGTLLAILAAITIENPGGWFKTLSIVAIGFFVLGIIFAIASYRPRKFNRSPQPLSFIASSHPYGADVIRRHLICNWVKDFSHNKQVLLQKKYYLEHSAVFVVIGILCLASSVAIKIAIS